MHTKHEYTSKKKGIKNQEKLSNISFLKSRKSQNQNLIKGQNVISLDLYFLHLSISMFSIWNSLYVCEQCINDFFLT